MPPRRWIFRDRDRHLDPRACAHLAAGLGISTIAARLLLNRGVADAERGRAYLTPALRHLHDPFLFRDMERAAGRLALAIARREPILVHGDYDVDGMTGTALLARLLELLGGDVRALVPERSEGYGLSERRALEAARAGVRVIVAVDNGTSALAAAEAARAAGIDLIVADHHPPEGLVAPAFALLNPSVEGETYPFRGLCGAGVAFKLAWAVAQSASPGRRASPGVRESLLDALSLVAIGTVADVVPLEGENRALVRFGLRALAATRRPGVRALLERCRLEGEPREEDIAFRLAPRLNAAGRMGAARLGLALLREESEPAAQGLADRLDAENRRRQEVEREVLAAALDAAPRALEAAQGRAIVLAEQGWHLGVVGIVAARLVERFWRPAVLVALEGARGRGSARSVPGIALPQAFARCREHLLGFGGHAAAAGVEIEASKVSAFRAALGAVLAEAPPPEDAGPPLEIDAEVGLTAVSRALVAELDRFAPWGRGNEPPLFAASGVSLAAAPRVVGSRQDHLQLLLRQEGAVLKGIGFGLGARAAALLDAGREARLDVAFRPQVSRWSGAETVEVEVKDLRLSTPAS
jgi:single-stranded-DNA-specific exonuclease